MVLSLSWWRKRLFGISPDETTFARRGFRGGELAARRHLEQVGAAFVQGYHAALEVVEALPLAERLNQVEPEWRGFAFEGAAMALALLDRLTPWRHDRWLAFVQGPAKPHIYMAHVGVGWVLARLRRHVEPALVPFDPLLRWLVVDGYGFHEGYFHWPKTVEEQHIPAQLTGYARRAFDLGLGRSLWFVRAADPAAIAQTIAGFAPTRQGDLWSGVGLACTYAGGAEPEAVQTLGMAAGVHHSQLAQGAAFAAKARLRAGNLVSHTELACQVLCGMTAEEAARVTDRALENLPANGPIPAFEVWRQRIQAHWGQKSEPLAKGA